MPRSFDLEASAATPNAVLLIVHGLAEYAGRYRAIADALAARGISTYSFDQRGHGSSPGPRTHVEKFDHFVDDVAAAIRELTTRNPALPLFVWGHSMGSVIALLAVARESARVDGFVATSNPLEVFKRGTNPLHPLFRFGSRLFPKVRVPLHLDSTRISSDEAVQRAYATDPLIPTSVSLRFIVEFAQACERARTTMSSLKLPMLIVHGEADRIAPPRGSQLLFDGVSSTDKTLQMYPDLRHEVHNERSPYREGFVDLLAGWVSPRALARGPIGDE